MSIDVNRWCSMAVVCRCLKLSVTISFTLCILFVWMEVKKINKPSEPVEPPVPKYDLVDVSIEVEEAIEQNEIYFDDRFTTELSTSYALWSQKTDSVNWSATTKMCSKVLAGQRPHPMRLEPRKSWTIPHAHTDQSISRLLSNCTEFRRLVRFASQPGSEAEAEFPLAYVLVGARNAAQLVRFFRMIYQPQNVYCLTYDEKAKPDFKNTVRQLAKCFSEENVFLTPEPEKIYYFDFSILHSVMVCMKALTEKWKSVPWKYVQVTSWNDFPLRTNSEMVEIFKILNGSQDCLIDLPRRQFYMYHQGVSYNAMRSVPPDGLTIYKGSFATSMTKEFIDFLFANPSALKLFKWLNGSRAPEEHFWPTIVHNTHLHAPGSFPGECYNYYAAQKKRIKPFLSRYQSWINDGWYEKNECRGQWVWLSCVFGVGDVPTVIKRPELMAHKFYEEFEPAALFCMEHWFWNRSHAVPLRSFNAKYYESLPSVRYHNQENKEGFMCSPKPLLSV